MDVTEEAHILWASHGPVFADLEFGIAHDTDVLLLPADVTVHDEYAYVWDISLFISIALKKNAHEHNRPPTSSAYS